MSDNRELGDSEYPTSSKEVGHSGFHSRLHFLVNRAKSVRSFAISAGISQTGLQRLLSGGEPTLSTLIAIAKEGGVSVDWLATGEGICQSGAALPTLVRDTLGNPVDPDDFVFVPRYYILMSAGHGAFWQEEQLRDVIAFRRDWIRRHLNCSAPENLVAAIVTGDSMEPTLHNNDTIIIDRGTTEIKDGIYAISYDNRQWVKRLRPQDDGSLLVISDNPDYLSFRLTDERDNGFIVHGRVCCRLADKPPTTY
ncbi:MAG: helix-turn-helix transcriptional regulator [Proteobacteria bacterium]|nr:helix-turn-helix transcriptional regulator [Pseudomonadota bacterium]MCL2306703.1 helix-turn-helix transcriptional regulator [Pseudomonadota bacterium]